MAVRVRVAFVRLTSRATAAAPGTRPCEGTVINSTALTSVTRPSGGGTSRPTNAMARLAVGDPSTPTMISRTRCDCLTTSTAHVEPRTTPRETLPISRRRTAPCPRQPTTITSARKRSASPRIPSTGALSRTSISTSGQRRASARRALSAALSAPRSSAVNRIDRLYSARVLRALIARTRVRAGHGKCRVVAIAALAWREPSVATRTRNSFCLAMLCTPRSHGSANPVVLSTACRSAARAELRA